MSEASVSNPALPAVGAQWLGGARSRLVRRQARAFVVAAALTVVASGIFRAVASDDPPAWPVLDEPPATLAATGLYSDPSTRTIADGVLAFTPQYPLWTDGAAKRRWIYLPAAVDARDPDAWVFPVGTRVWKEFAFGRRVETRFMTRTATGWKYATYAWSADGTTATRVADAGARVELGGGRAHRIPSAADCHACHDNAAAPILGFSALQLSADRDPWALHPDRAPGSVDLEDLVATGAVDGVVDVAPRIAGSPVQRSALGYLHGNCGGCHRAEGLVAGVGMVLAHDVGALAIDEPAARTTIDRPSHFAAPARRVVPGDPGASVLIARMQARHSIAQMPPLGTERVDEEAVQLVSRWIDQLAPSKEKVR